ncbi:MAG: hypothetical protein FWE26_05290 [Coriobacteriia bacterium]|nr:hypothetical protein [Coriobacteriia bacterium]
MKSKTAKLLATACLAISLLLPSVVMFPVSGYAWMLSGTNQTVARSGPSQNWNVRGRRVGGHALGTNSSSSTPMQIRIQAFRANGALSFSTTTTLASGQRNIRTGTQLGCTAPWTFGNHPFRVWIQPVNGRAWTGSASIVRTQ